MKTCPFCAERIQSAAIKCRYCGERLDQTTATVDSGEQRNEIKCPNCGYERIKGDDEVISRDECPKCGIYYKKYSAKPADQTNADQDEARQDHSQHQEAPQEAEEPPPLPSHVSAVKKKSIDWYLEVLKKYAVFNGRARRKEYWMFVLYNSIIGLLLGITEGISGTTETISLLSVVFIIYMLAVMIPGIAVTVRRLHDTNRSGWWFLWSLVPLIGAIVLLVIMAKDSDEGDNQYGPNPKALTDNRSMDFTVPIIMFVCLSVIFLISIYTSKKLQEQSELQQQNTTSREDNVSDLDPSKSFKHDPPNNTSDSRIPTFSGEDEKRLFEIYSPTDYYQYLDRIVPEWRSINKDPGFLVWLSGYDYGSSFTRHALLSAAHARFDAHESALYFSRYMKEFAASQAVNQPSQTTELKPDDSKVFEIYDSRDRKPYNPTVKQPSKTTARVIAWGERFISNKNGTVSDRWKNLMWAAKDNGHDVNWHDATSYCEHYRGGGYTDWRMPTEKELVELSDLGKTNRHGYNVTDLIELTSCCPWASKTDGTGAAFFNFSLGMSGWNGHSYDTNRGRALPVRSVK